MRLMQNLSFVITPLIPIMVTGKPLWRIRRSESAGPPWRSGSPMCSGGQRLHARVPTLQVTSTRSGAGPTCERATSLYRVLNDHQIELEHQGMENWLLRKTLKEEKAVADAEIEEYQRRQWKAYETSNREHAKCERYCREQRDEARAHSKTSRQVNERCTNSTIGRIR